ncbi:MAG: nuclear transport factor 2 family protein, partial [Solirubrobacterales bacterium]
MAQDNVDVVQHAWDAFGRGDIDAVLDAIAPNAETRLPESLPWGGTYRGPEGFRDFLTKLGEAFEQFKATPQKVLGADDNHVIVVARTKGKARGGDVLEGSIVWLYQLRDGKI